MKEYCYTYDFGILKLTIYSNEKGITKISAKQHNEINCVKKETPLIKKAYKQLTEYFSGQRQKFDLPLIMKGTDFQIKVWKALQTIPYGEVRTYKQIAEQVNCKKGYRAVGMANNKNKFVIVVPCHRVIGSNKKLVGYDIGLEIKQYLLDLEQKVVK